MKNNHVKWIMDLWADHKLHIALLLFMTLLSTSVAVAYPFVFKYLLDVLQKVTADNTPYNEAMEKIYKICWIIAAIGGVKLISSFYPAVRAMMNSLFEYVLRNRYFKHMLEKDFNFFMHFRTGDLVTRLTSDIQDFPRIGWFICSGIFRAFDSFIKISFCLAMMFFMNWKLTAVAVIPLPLMVVAFYITSERLHKNFKKNQEAISEINNQLEMTFSGIRIIKSFVCEEKYNRFFSNSLENRFKTEMKVVKINTLLNLVYEYIDYFAMIGVILYGGFLVVKGEITIGTFYAFYTYLSMMIFPILDLPQLFISGKQAFVCIDRLEEIKDYQSSKSDQSTQPTPINSAINQIRFEDITFNYESRIYPALQGINFTIHKGQKLLIVGPAGAGKSTVLGLLTGLYKANSGNVFINNQNLDELCIKDLRDKIGYVPQEPSLFSGTIRENILFGIENPDMDLYAKIIDAVQMKDEIDQFLLKDLSRVGQKGLSLSGGQKQRIAIARALMKKPEILILDDITASLDAQKEELLWGQISCLFEDITALIVSHRLSSLRYVDMVLLLDSGKIIAQGKHDDLIDTHQDYKDFILHRNIDRQPSPSIPANL
ncbi:MAG TPA: ABC transporter ATP-binding protein [Candidatus Cloacimonadota bacterium]|nr:ABC transporter ATP-binding protein [Candidatus Cloacimonadota bacterium]HPK40164.1 ABC transporter ATP-binding protein [Candidatus Cloacimonadota bacterium]